MTFRRAALLVVGAFLVAVMAGALLGGGDGERTFSAASAPRLMSHAPPMVDSGVNDLALGRPAAIPPEPAAVAPRELRSEVATATPVPVETPVTSGAEPEPTPTPTAPSTAPVTPSPSPSVRRPRPTPVPTFDDSGSGDFDFPGEP